MKIFANPISRLILLLQVPLVLSAVFAVIPQLTFAPLGLYWRVVVMALLILVLIETKQDLIMLALVIGGSLGFLAGKMGAFGILSGGARYTAGYGGMMSDNNTYAMALAMGLPICWYLKDLVTQRWLKMGLMALAILSIPGVLMTYSRGVAVSMGVGIILIAFRSRHKILMATGVAVFGLVLISFLGATYSERLGTLLDPTVEASANSRITFAKAALRMAADYPLFGVGFGKLNQQRLFGNYVVNHDGFVEMVVHNSYLQMLVDAGIFALIIFVMLIAVTILLMQRSYQHWKKTDPSLTPIPLMLQTTLLIYAVDALVLSHHSFDLFYMTLTMAAAWLEIEKTEQPSAARHTASPPAMSKLIRQPLSQLPVPAPISRQQTEVPLSRRQPKVGIATAREAELRNGPGR
jgi:probable O-glycosylation ligase (exosortase A-associated)